MVIPASHLRFGGDKVRMVITANLLWLVADRSVVKLRHPVNSFHLLFQPQSWLTLFRSRFMRLFPLSQLSSSDSVRFTPCVTATFSGEHASRAVSSTPPHLGSICGKTNWSWELVEIHLTDTWHGLRTYSRGPFQHILPNFNNAGTSSTEASVLREAAPTVTHVSSVTNLVTPRQSVVPVSHGWVPPLLSPQNNPSPIQSDRMGRLLLG